MNHVTKLVGKLTFISLQLSGMITEQDNDRETFIGMAKRPTQLFDGQSCFTLIRDIGKPSAEDPKKDCINNLMNLN